MNPLKTITIASLITSTFGILMPILTAPSLAEDPPAKTYQPGFWQPVARVNPQQPVRVNLINKTSSGLNYSLTTGEIGTRQVAAGNTTELTNLPKEAYLVINPQTPSISIRFKIEVVGNNMVKITATPSPDPSGESTINIQSNGGIYKY